MFSSRKFSWVHVACLFSVIFKNFIFSFLIRLNEIIFFIRSTDKRFEIDTDW